MEKRFLHLIHSKLPGWYRIGSDPKAPSGCWDEGVGPASILHPVCCCGSRQPACIPNNYHLRRRLRSDPPGDFEKFGLA